ncbi:MAG: hypothetical protein ACLPX8_18650 [Bryobacteraceae bacterium]|jgi:hypothetical protein
MSKRRGLVLFALFAALFLVMNRASYRGYFQADDLETLSWAPRLPAADYLAAVFSPRFQTDNFRPVPHFFYHALEPVAGLDFPVYLAILQAIHLLNVWLLWLLARELGASKLPAAAACLFFGLHMALFDDFWKPMYVFDVLCGTFSLASLLLYASARWWWSFAAFWLAYKSKELAVMLPVALAAYELWYGGRRWKRLLPFLAVSLSFGAQGILFNPNRDNNYTLRFTAAALAKTGQFYAQRVFLVPYLGFLAPLAVLVWRRPRVWLGTVVLLVFFFPLLFLPGRLLSAYCYLPFSGLALALSGIAEGTPPAALAAFLVLWAPADLRELRLRRAVTLAHDQRVEIWVEAIRQFALQEPVVGTVVYKGRIAGFEPWGVAGTLRYFLHRPDLPVQDADDPGAPEILAGPDTALLLWDAGANRLSVKWPGR